MSTAIPSTMPNEFPSTMFAVFRATPRSVIRSSIVPGTSPPYSSTIRRHASRIEIAFWLKNPVAWMSAFSSSSGTRR